MLKANLLILGMLILLRQTDGFNHHDQVIQFCGENTQFLPPVFKTPNGIQVLASKQYFFRCPTKGDILICDKFL